MSVWEKKQRKRADWVWKESTLSANTLVIYGWNIFTALLWFCSLSNNSEAPCFLKPNKAYDLYISRFHRTNSPFSYFKSIWNSTRPDMHYQIQFLIFFTSLHFIHPLRYSNHNALASSGCKNVLISFDSCPLSPHSLRFSSLLLCLCELGLFGGPHKSVPRSEGPAPHTERNPPTQWETKTHRPVHAHSLAQIRHTINEC